MLKRLIMSISIALVLTVVTSQLSGVKADYEEYEGIHDNVLRLHVIANSDRESDQKLKLALKDEIVKLSQSLFRGSQSVEQTKAIAKENLGAIKNMAAGFIQSKGYSYPVKVTLDKLNFPQKDYDGFTMPSGVYSSLNVEIGKASGKNWWCVLYPTMCIGTAVASPQADSDELEEESGDSFSQKQRDMLEQPSRYNIKFALFEMFDNLIGKNSGAKRYDN